VKRALFIALGICALGIAGLFGPVDGVRANGVPQLVKLTYLSGVSNWGPNDAEGVLEFSFAEAYARVDVKNLKPVDGYTYEGWLTGGSGQPLLVGTIEPGSDGVGVLDTKLSNLSRYDYNLFVVTGRSVSTAAGAMPAQKSIAGRFTVISDAATTTSGDTRPGLLPDTGEKPGLTTRERIGRTMIVAGSVAGLGVVVLLYLRRREKARD
jgi:hypothetical protein